MQQLVFILIIEIIAESRHNYILVVIVLVIVRWAASKSLSLAGSLKLAEIETENNRIFKR